jgi:hypothetical protein
MSSTLFIIIMLIVLIGLWAACMLGPRWFARSLHRHRMWRLRDELVDDMIVGRFPRDHDAVRHLQGKMDTTLRLGPNVTLSDVLIFHRYLAKLSPSARRFVAKPECPTDGLSDDQRAALKKYEDEFGLLVVGLLFLGSWFGLIFIIGTFVSLTLRRLVKIWRAPISIAAIQRVLGSIARQATDKAADSPIGHRVSETLPALPKDYAARPAIAHISLLHSHSHVHSASNGSVTHSAHD